ncbi:MAG: hypothetical protein JSV78_05045 [Phycisphaerales bacterium]|nr:MAG: hypothetical protein JSV78_05045 [Phycisphaerales bacterium]
MNDEFDPTRKAMDLLSSRQWDGARHSAKLKEDLTRQYDMKSASQTTHRHRLWVAALAVLILAGSGFALTGGVEKIKNWLVRIEINGEVAEVELDESGQGTFTIGSVDAGQTTVHISNVEVEATGIPPDLLPEDLLGEEANIKQMTVRIEAADGECDLADPARVQKVKKVIVNEDGIPAELQEFIDQLVAEGDGELEVVDVRMERKLIRTIENGEESEVQQSQAVVRVQTVDGEEQVFELTGEGDELEGLDFAELLDRPTDAEFFIDDDGVPVLRITGDDGAQRLVKVRMLTADDQGERQMMNITVDIEATKDLPVDEDS